MCLETLSIEVNGEPKSVTANTLDKVLLECGYKSLAIATALNGTFVHKQQRAKTSVQAGDKIEVVAPIEGG